MEGRFCSVHAYLIEGEYAEVDVPILHVDEPVGSIGHTIDRNLHLLGAFRLRFFSDGFHDFFNWDDRSKDVGTRCDGHNARLRRDERNEVFDLELDRVGILGDGWRRVP